MNGRVTLYYERQANEDTILIQNVAESELTDVCNSNDCLSRVTLRKHPNMPCGYYGCSSLFIENLEARVVSCKYE